jgi:hypothetical protein
MPSSDSDHKWKLTWKKFPHRKWEDLRDAWVAHVPTLLAACAQPDPGLENLPELLQLSPNDWLPVRYSDVIGLRTNAVWEAVFLFHKCSHTNLAAQRLAVQGMHSWCLFNAYHAAYLGAKGIMALLGVALPNLKGTQVALDLFPEPKPQPKRHRASGGLQFEEFVIVRLQQLDQRRVWEGLQRLLRVTEAECWDEALTSEIVSVGYATITPPRNHFLYKAHYWPLDDLAADAVGTRLNTMIIPELDAENGGFLLRLSFLVYHLFENLINDLAECSPVIRSQAAASRFLVRTAIPELDLYRDFISQVGASS